VTEKIGSIRMQFFIPINLQIQIREASINAKVSMSEFIRSAVAQKLFAERKIFNERG